MVRWLFGIVALFLLLSADEAKNDDAIATVNGLPVFGFPDQVWSDEFNYDGRPDPSRWSYDVGDGCPKKCGWGNQELQYYTDKPANAEVKEGSLRITAFHQKQGKREYTSARLTTKNKFAWNRGCIEVRARLPQAVGTWPAIWMLPDSCHSSKWLACGEIDIMEHVGFHPNEIYTAVHTRAFNSKVCNAQGDMIRVADAVNDFNLYTMEWTDEQLLFKINDQVYYRFPKYGNSLDKWPFDKNFYLIMNIAVGGGWGGLKGIDECWPQTMEVDYVRVYR